MKKWIVLLLVGVTLACTWGNDYDVQLDSKSDGAPQATVVLEVRK